MSDLKHLSLLQLRDAEEACTQRMKSLERTIDEHERECLTLVYRSLAREDLREAIFSFKAQLNGLPNRLDWIRKYIKDKTDDALSKSQS